MHAIFEEGPTRALKSKVLSAFCRGGSWFFLPKTLEESCVHKYWQALAGCTFVASARMKHGRGIPCLSNLNESKREWPGCCGLDVGMKRSSDSEDVGIAWIQAVEWTARCKHAAPSCLPLDALTLLVIRHLRARWPRRVGLSSLRRMASAPSVSPCNGASR